MHGEMTAILGSSGAGKTTLLNILAKKIGPGEGQLEGRVQVNGCDYSEEEFGEFGNYVMQHDVLAQVLTVRECLQFAADLKVGAAEEVRKARVARVLREFKLEKCADTLVGGPLLKGISGGEKKRTSIGFEMMSDPQLIMLDEPTSGLDSFTALLIVNYLRRLAEEEGRTIIMTIHQPSNDIF
jgi:ABC-type multidrug transport system ATPase subunit